MPSTTSASSSAFAISRLYLCGSICGFAGERSLHSTSFASETQAALLSPKNFTQYGSPSSLSLKLIISICAGQMGPKPRHQTLCPDTNLSPLSSESEAVQDSQDLNPFPLKPARPQMQQHSPGDVVSALPTCPVPAAAVSSPSAPLRRFAALASSPLSAGFFASGPRRGRPGRASCSVSTSALAGDLPLLAPLPRCCSGLCGSPEALQPRRPGVCGSSEALPWR
mmetsp:Transcript_23727/g.67866  ORF Transcript_23727/g.67866 Transcript_23727/m.67866 type:complete len:224 (+) Transcript_23727:103-774(+)